MRLFKTASSRRKSAVSIASLDPSNFKGPFAVSVRSEMSDSRDSITSLSAISSGPRSTISDTPHKYVRRPNLSQILADQAPAPWTLEAFTSYAERNMCLENIEFIQDAERYRAAYLAVINRDAKWPSVHDDDERPPLARMDSAQTETLKELWTRMMLLYVAPSSPKELNLPSSIRAGLIPHNKTSIPPSPHLLDPAVQIIFELIEDSILFSFLNEVSSSDQRSLSSKDDLAYEMEKPKHAVPELEKQRSAPVSSSGTRSPRLGGFGFSKSRSHTNSSAKTSSNNFSPSGSRPPSVTPITSEDSTSAVVSPVSTREMASSSKWTPPSSSDGPQKSVSPKTRKDGSWKRVSARLGFSRKNGTHLRDVVEDQ